jgi:hypothetical protein
MAIMLQGRSQFPLNKRLAGGLLRIGLHPVRVRHLLMFLGLAVRNLTVLVLCVRVSPVSLGLLGLVSKLS